MMNLARRVLVAVLVAAVLSLNAGCVYMNVKQPLDTDLQNTELGSKVGKSDAQSVLGLVAWGDASTRAAAKNGGITTIKHADQQVYAILGFVYTRVKTIVYGD